MIEVTENELRGDPGAGDYLVSVNSMGIPGATFGQPILVPVKNPTRARGYGFSKGSIT